MNAAAADDDDDNNNNNLNYSVGGHSRAIYSTSSTDTDAISHSKPNPENPPPAARRLTPKLL